MLSSFQGLEGFTDLRHGLGFAAHCIGCIAGDFLSLAVHSHAGEAGRFKAVLAHIDGLILLGGVLEISAGGNISLQTGQFERSKGVFVGVRTRQLEGTLDRDALAVSNIFAVKFRPCFGEVECYSIALRHAAERAAGEGGRRGAVVDLAFGGDVCDGDGGGGFDGAAYTDILGVKATEEAIGHPRLLAVIGHGHRAPKVMAGLGEQRETQIVVVIA